MSRQKFQERTYNKYRRKILRYFNTEAQERNKLNHIVSELYDALVEDYEDDIALLPYHQILVLLDAESLNVGLAAISIDVLGKQAYISVDEQHDIYGVGRLVKKLLDARGYHIYYENECIEYRANKLAIGLEAVLTLRAMFPDNSEKKDVIH